MSLNLNEVVTKNKDNPYSNTDRNESLISYFGSFAFLILSADFNYLLSCS